MIHQTVSSENLSAFSTNRPINNGPRTCGDLLLMVAPLSPREILRNFPLPPQGGRREPVPLTQVAGRLDALEVGGFRDLRRGPVGAPYIETSKDEIVNQYELMMMRMIEDEDEDGFGCVNYFDVNLCGQVGGGQTQQHGSLFGL